VVTRKAYRFRIYPTADKAARLARWNDALRFLWNLANEQRLAGLAKPRGYRRYYTAFDQINDLTALRAQLPWLAEVPRNVCAQLLTELDKAWQRCFKKLARAPRWKRKGRDIVGLCEPHPKVWRLEGTTLRFPKIGAIRCVTHRKLEGKPKTCTIKRDGDQWFASIISEEDVSEPIPKTEPVVAIDRGVINVVADSDGRLTRAPRHYQRALRRLARAQRRVSRRKKGSKNREKAKSLVMRLHRKVRRQREHFLHVLSYGYANSHGTVVIEKLQIKNMVKANRGLAQGILDAGWGMFANMLQYKLGWRGGKLVQVNPAYSSQTCSDCGRVDPKSRASQSTFCCTSCGYHNHADLNAAKVLKLRACESLVPACGGPLKLGTRRSRKQLGVSRRSLKSSAL
jgi:putative transposase